MEIPFDKIVSTGDGDTSVPFKRYGENIVPVGCFYDEGERYEALMELLLSSVFPLFYKLNERILTLFQCKQENISYDFALYNDQPETLSLSRGMRLIIEKLQRYRTDDFNLYLNINCTHDLSDKRQEWGKQIWLAFGDEHWYDEELDVEYPVWFLYIENEKTLLETPFSKKQADAIITSATRHMLSFFIDTYGPNEMQNADDFDLFPKEQKQEFDEIIQNLFVFLKNHRRYNYRFQLSEFRKILLPHTDPHERLISLLYHVYNTQSQPGMDNLAAFMGKFYQYSRVSSFREFIKLLTKHSNVSYPLTYEGLFDCMRNQSGWGDKTAALFTKAIYEIHNSKFTIDLRFWNDMPALGNTDKLYLPVDAVIQKIFDEITDGKLKGFARINQYLQSRYAPEEIEIWDDLWFWGFITQRSNGKGEREEGFAFNKSKYWSLMAVPKNEDAIIEIRVFSNEFIAIITGCYE